MRYRKILAALCAATALLCMQPVHGYGSRESEKALAVDFQTFELDGQVHDLMWCGQNDEIILGQSSDGTIYRSRDRGLSWKRLKNLMHKAGQAVSDENQDVSIKKSVWLSIMKNLLTGMFCLDREGTQDDVESS